VIPLYVDVWRRIAEQPLDVRVDYGIDAERIRISPQNPKAGTSQLSDGDVKRTPVVVVLGGPKHNQRHQLL
jgi:hypothetical protein